jgi:hypothetical protein
MLLTFGLELTVLSLEIVVMRKLSIGAKADDLRPADGNGHTG